MRRTVREPNQNFSYNVLIINRKDYKNYILSIFIFVTKVTQITYYVLVSLSVQQIKTLFDFLHLKF